MVDRAQAQGLRITAILNTHGHADHSNGNGAAKALTGAPVAGRPGPPGRLWTGCCGTATGWPSAPSPCSVWHVPGHCPDHLAFLAEPLQAGITGDLLFVGKVGRHRQRRRRPDRNGTACAACMREWPPHATVWPGHDYGARPSSTVAWERASNPFLLCPDVAAFIRLKADWPAFKAKHSLK